VPLLVHYQIDTMGYGEQGSTMSLAPKVVMYGSVHSTISENENTGSRIKDFLVLFIAGAPHQFSRPASAFIYYLLRPTKAPQWI
jgi:hypothetical protein